MSSCLQGLLVTRTVSFLCADIVSVVLRGHLVNKRGVPCHCPPDEPPPLWWKADISSLRLQRPVCTHAQLRQVEFGVGVCGRLPIGVASSVVLIVGAAVRRWRGRCGVPVGRDVGRDGATPNAECTPEHCEIVLTSAYFERRDALSPFYCFFFCCA